jgi:replicative DNA helicase
MSTDGLKYLGTVLDNGATRSLSELTEGYFVGDDEHSVYEFIKRYQRDQGSMPEADLVQSETGIIIPDVSGGVDFWSTKIRQRHTYEELRPLFREFRDNMQSRDMASLQTISQEITHVMRSTNRVSEVMSMEHIATQVFDEYRNAARNPGLTGIPTGWGFLDQMTSGWQPGDLNMLIARPMQGKTMLMLRGAIAAHDAGFSVLVVSMEMTLPHVGRRVLGLQAGVDPLFIKKGQLSNHAMDRVSGSAQLFRGGRFNLVAGNLHKHMGNIDALIEEYAPDIVYIDGIYLMFPERAQNMIKRAEKMEVVVSEIKANTIVRNVPMLCTSQFNRSSGSGGQEGTLDSIGYSDAVATDSSVVLGVRPGKPPYQKSRRMLSLLKGRDGETGDYEVNYSFAPMNFDQVIESETGEDDTEWTG